MKPRAFAVMLATLLSQALMSLTISAAPLEKFLPESNPVARRLATEQFNLVDDLTKVDPQILEVFHSKVVAADIANRGEPFNSTDVVTDKKPMRRFVLAGTGPNIWFILYEHGGIAYHHNLVVFVKDEHWQIVAAVQGMVRGDVNFESLKKAIAAGNFFGQPDDPDF